MNDVFSVDFYVECKTCHGPVRAEFDHRLSNSNTPYLLVEVEPCAACFEAAKESEPEPLEPKHYKPL